MLILSKYIIKSSLIILLFTTTTTNYLYAITILNDSKESLINLNYSNTGTTEHFNTSGYSFIISNDTITSAQNDVVKKTGTNDNSTVPAGLINAPINFQVNSSIYYLNIKQFINAEAKKSFIQGWLKENELHRLSLYADSLRNAYAVSSDEEREKISAQILQSEQAAVTLNEEIPAAYEKAREQENLYWQSASVDEINQFQQKISRYEDSIAHAKQVALHSELPDTITVYMPTKNHKEPEQKAEVPTGIIYKIQIGAFKGKIPETTNKLIKKISVIRKVENQVDDKGVKVYTTGNLRTYAEAETMLSQVKQEGVKNAMITAYQNKKKIAIAEAKKLNNEL
ncbi:MAG: SPOR domain-containing protein [Bacteroidales bacterium]